jgi:hypothetical protein
MDPVVAGGLIGVGGTLLGVAVQDSLTRLRERRHRRRLARRAVTAIAGELVATISILDKALERQAWWPERDEPRRDEWDRYRDALPDDVEIEAVMRIGIVYDTIRSLAATRSSPLTPLSKGRMARMLRDDPEGRSFFSLIGTDDRWPWAEEETMRTRASVWQVLTEYLWPLQKRLLKPAQEEPWQSPEGGPAAIRPTVMLAPNGPEWAQGQAQYDGLVAALGQAGLDASVQEPRDGKYASGGIVTDPLIDLSIFVWEHVSDELIGVLVALAIERLRRRTKRSRKGVIYGPGGEILREFELPSDDEP